MPPQAREIVSVALKRTASYGVASPDDYVSEAEDVEELLLPSWLLRRLPAVAPAGRREQGAEADALQEAIGLLE